jgi:nitroreductase
MQRGYIVSIIEVMHKRQSWRTFSKKHVEPEKINALKEFMQANTTGVFGSAMRFELINFDTTPNAMLKGMGTYSVIKDARIFMAGCVKRGPRALEDYGYAMENNILKAVELGLATCWLGATFDRHGFCDHLKCTADEIVPGVIPVGYAADKRRLADSLMRKVANSDTRKHLFEISFLDDFETPRVPENKYKHVLECVKLAPSATNQQPWRMIKEDGKSIFHLYLERTKGYNYPAGQNIDMGIAMCHFELAAKELGLAGNWGVSDPKIEAGGREYIATWK